MGASYPLKAEGAPSGRGRRFQSLGEEGSGGRAGGFGQGHYGDILDRGVWILWNKITGILWNTGIPPDYWIRVLQGLWADLWANPPPGRTDRLAS